MDYTKTLKAFKKFLENYDLQNAEIMLKVKHSYEMASLAKKLAINLNLNNEQVTLAQTIGLLHDLGRFIGYDLTKSYYDYQNNIDHAELGVNYLFKEGHIREFVTTDKYDEIIKTAIFNHNKYQIAKNLDNETKLMAKLIRDADKIDIFRQNAMGFENLYQEPASSEMLDLLEQEKMARPQDIKNKSDEILFHLMYLFDINYKESFELLSDTDNLELYFSMIEVAKHLDEEFNKVKKILRKYLKKKLEE